MKKWRNKITGEINEFMVHKRIEDSEDGNPVYAPFDGNIDEWEDVPEEPKKYWYIYADKPQRADCGDILEEDFKAIGNYFETKEEAEKAVRKLKAWKRLKEKGFRFEGWDNTDRSTIHNFSLFVAIEDLESINKDLDLLFCTEENS